ncbi:MAG TPA: hypothetical protein VHA33_30740 [Candidatus Angelobacter sp.]|jgi:hypothetical protein|nr:hypothetical protein [Candidatus Angelobacter sp.]
MARFGFGISGILILLCGWATALPQAQIQTGVSANGAQVMNPATNAAGSVPVKQDQQKPSPAITGTLAPVVPQQQQVAVPLRPEQMPPVPPKVIYQNGLLSVEATNSTLSDVLNGIRSKAGIQIEGFQGAQERVAAKLGPAPAEAVLIGLLRGSHFDYMILGRPGQPSIVQRVILTPISGTATASNPAQPFQPRPGMVMVQPVDDDEANPDEANISQPQVQPVPQPVIQPQPVQQPGNAAQGNNVKTQEQLFEDLKRIQQQQQNQQQNGQNPQPIAPLKPRIPQ